MSTELKPTSIAFEKRYSDDSGVQFAVRFQRNRSGEQVLEFEAVNAIEFPIEQIDWLIARLEYIRAASMAPQPALAAKTQEGQEP